MTLRRGSTSCASASPSARRSRGSRTSGPPATTSNGARASTRFRWPAAAPPACALGSREGPASHDRARSPAPPRPSDLVASGGALARRARVPRLPLVHPLHEPRAHARRLDRVQLEPAKVRARPGAKAFAMTVRQPPREILVTWCRACDTLGVAAKPNERAELQGTHCGSCDECDSEAVEIVRFIRPSITHRTMRR